MSLTTSTLLVNNALFFGGAIVLVLVQALLLSRLSTRLIHLGLRAARTPTYDPLATRVDRRVGRFVALIATLACVALIAAAILLSMWEIDVAPHVWAFARARLLHDPMAALWLAGELLAVALGALLLHRVLRALVDILLAALARNPSFADHGPQLTILLARLLVLLRWGMVFAALLVAADLATLPETVREPLTAATYIAVGVLVARTLVVVAGIGVDVVFQAIRAFQDRKTPLRYLGRLEHLAGVTKRTLEYFCFIGAATWVIHQLRPGTWLAETGLVAIRLIALVYVARVLIAVVELVLRELLMSDRSEAESQQRLTLLPVARSVLRYAVYFCVTVMALQELGVDSSPILAGAGLLGLAVGLGAQTRGGDIVSGFFILFEGMFLVGDRVRIGDTIGNVEEIGIRVLKIRDEFGVLHCIPNGEVRSIANHTHLFVNAVVEFSVPYDADIPALLTRLRAHIIELRPRYPDILEDPEVVVQELRASAALIRCLTRVKPGRDDAVAEQLRGELLAALTAANITPQACEVIKLHGGPGERARRPESGPRAIR
jgi:small conductance mechanosensitive channel